MSNTRQLITFAARRLLYRQSGLSVCVYRVVSYVYLMYNPYFRLGSFAVMLAGCDPVPNAVRPTSLAAGPRRPRTQFLSKPAPDVRLLPGGIYRSPIRCKFHTPLAIFYVDSILGPIFYLLASNFHSGAGI